MPLGLFRLFLKLIHKLIELNHIILLKDNLQLNLIINYLIYTIFIKSNIFHILGLFQK